MNVHTGKDSRYVLVGDPDGQFVTDESLGLLYSTSGNELRAFEMLAR